MKWTPTLFRVDQNAVRMWTGSALALRMIGHLGLRSNGGSWADVNFPQNGIEYGYCWSGLSSGLGYNFTFTHISGATSTGVFKATAT